ncbi:MAG TPA: Gmad2 immunoglobulin-like domain-containing protein [Angustibacter sp.]|nr:Gmad2 immunoglobulin-like domain-containing protein [Angustibacter sp.]
MSREDDPTSLSGLPGPDDDPTAAALQRALARDAASIEPRDRLDDVRRGTDRRRRWPAAVAAVAAVAAIAALGTQLAGTGRDDVGPSGGSRTTASTSASDTASATTASGQATTVLPVYYLGRDGDRWALFREFHRRTTADSPAARLQLALDEATMNQAVVDPDLTSPWSPRTEPLGVTRSGDVVTVDVPAADAQPGGRTAEQARLAVQQLVWTATAVTQDSALGVRVLIDGAPGQLFGQEPVGDVVHRASPSYTVLGSVWIEAPDEGQTVGSPVTVRGSACVFEATVSWQLLREGQQVSAGHTTATSGCPQRGTWSVDLGALAPGTYTFRAYEAPASDTGPDREDTRTFVVR